MGGNAIKGAFTRRYKKEEFDNILPDILNKAKMLFKDAVSTTFFKSKESFGDADILCLVDDTISNTDIKQWIIDTFDSKEVVQNTTVYSFEYKELQVDFILTNAENWETSQTYYSYNDLHNLIGKVAHKFGLKWGHKGLTYVYRVDGKKLGDIIVSKDTTKVLQFLGFDSNKYNDGFDTIEEIFDFVTNSKYFNPWMFDFETLNRINRERDQKRTTYANFVKHVAPMKDLGKDSFHYFYPDKKIYLGLIDYYFPGFLCQYRELELKEERRKLIKSLYNGSIIMNEFNISGKILGNYMNNFTKSFKTLCDMEQYIIDTNDTNTILNKFSEINFLIRK